MCDRNAQDAILTFHRFHPVDEAAPRLTAGHKARDGPAVENRHDRLNFVPCGTKAKIDEIVGTFKKIRVWELFECDDDIRSRHHLVGQVTMHVELGSNHRAIASKRSSARQKVTLAVIVTSRHH